MAAGTLERIQAAVTVSAGDRPVIAVGWATVDIDRAAAELAADLGIAATAFVPAADSGELGARCRVASRVLPRGQSLAILEPLTEGRLAGSLARHGEGPAATWSRSAGAAKDRRAPARPGPFGWERVVSGGPAHGPYSLLLEDEPGTIHG